MERRITGFHRDAEGHWVADLDCGHGQHMRHNPPWETRPWVLTEEGRAERLRNQLNCTRCDSIPNWPLIAVVGATGAGKSELALQLAEEFKGEIVNCDSVQLYRYLDIGTAKVPLDRRRGIEHHLLDVLNPDEIFTAGDYMRAARTVLSKIREKRRIPVVVGGTGFYLRALLYGLHAGPVRDEQLRIRLIGDPASLHEHLRGIDPDAAARIHPNDTQKTIRAIEIRELSGAPAQDLFSHHREPLRGFSVCLLGLDPPRPLLANRIETRVEWMFEAGLIEEVEAILARGYTTSAKAFESIGYQQVVRHLSGALTRAQAVSDTQTKTRQYAKRQRTWFQREPGVQWINGFGENPATLDAAICHAKKLAGVAVNI